MAKDLSIEFPQPKLSKLLFSDTRFSSLWLLIRVYVGWAWLIAGWDKVQSPMWVGEKAGTALKGFLTFALTKTSGPHPDVSGWYAQFLSDFVMNNLGVFSHVIAFGELLVGIGLIIGAFTGIAAFFGAFMNMNYLLAGTVSTNPILLFFELFLILAWRVAGWWGLDRFLLPFLANLSKKRTLFGK